ncbi:phospholipid-translocating ATPase [Aureococcus anophagefferens]|nr:phospholipid-translocating ATPase [Aureococcus anophagefferens]
MQAVNNSDYAIAQFAFLQRLLLVHGRWNYRRTSKLVCHIFYKNVLQAMLTFWYASLNQMSGTKNVVEYAASTVFAAPSCAGRARRARDFERQFALGRRPRVSADGSTSERPSARGDARSSYAAPRRDAAPPAQVFYTAWPVILLGTFDQDVSAETALANPALYRAGPRDEFFTRPIFASWVFQAICEAFLAIYVPALALNASLRSGNADGGEWGLWEMGATAFTARGGAPARGATRPRYRFTRLDALWYFLSIGLWFAVATVYGLVSPGAYGGYPEWEWYYVFPRLLSQPMYWLSAALAIIIVFARDFGWKAYVHMRAPSRPARQNAAGSGRPDRRRLSVDVDGAPSGDASAALAERARRAKIRAPRRRLYHVHAEIQKFGAPAGAGEQVHATALRRAPASTRRSRASESDYRDSRPSVRKEDSRHDHELGFAFSTDTKSHAAEILHAKSQTAFPQRAAGAGGTKIVDATSTCGPVTPTRAVCRTDTATKVDIPEDITEERPSSP